MGPTSAFVAKGGTYFTRHPVHFVHIHWASFVLSITIFGQIAFVVSWAAHRPRGLGPAGGKVATFASGTGGIGEHGASFGVAAGIVTMILKATVAFFAGLNETVTAHGRLEELLGLVS